MSYSRLFTEFSDIAYLKTSLELANYGLKGAAFVMTLTFLLVSEEKVSAMKYFIAGVVGAGAGIGYGMWKKCANSNSGSPALLSSEAEVPSYDTYSV
jgi:hypothetical protein